MTAATATAITSATPIHTGTPASACSAGAAVATAAAYPPSFAASALSAGGAAGATCGLIDGADATIEPRNRNPPAPRSAPTGRLLSRRGLCEAASPFHGRPSAVRALQPA